MNFEVWEHGRIPMKEEVTIIEEEATPIVYGHLAIEQS